MNERELYALISYTFPGEDNENLAANTRLREAFKDSVIPLSDELLGVMNTPQSDTKSTPRENLLKARANLVEGISRLELGDPVPDGLTHAASKHGKAGCETYFEGAHAAQDIAQNAAK